MSAASFSNSRTRLRVSIVVLLSFVVISTVGYYWLGWPDRRFVHALYLTAMIFSTVGAIPDHMTSGEEMWTLAMIFVGIGSAAYAFGNVMAVMTSGQIQALLGRRQLTGKIESMSDHYIVCGYGRMGRSVCASLGDAGVDFVLVDHATDRTAKAGDRNYPYIVGEAADEVVLRAAGISRARGLVTCLPHDADNVFVTLTARGLNEHLTIIARSESEATESRLIRSGANRVVTPTLIGAHKITRMLLHPAVEDLIDATAAADLAIDRVSVGHMKGLAGRSLKELALPKAFGVMVLAVEQEAGKRLFNPPADHVLKESDQIILVGPKGSIERFLRDHEP